MDGRLRYTLIRFGRRGSGQNGLPPRPRGHAAASRPLTGPSSPKRVLPPECRETRKIRIGRNHRTSVLHRDRGVLGVRDQLSDGSRRTAQVLEDRHVIGTVTNDSSVRAFRERGHESECLVKRGWRIRHPRVGHDANETGENEHREREGLRSGGHASDPPRVRVVLRGRAVDVCVDQYVDVGQEHGESAASEAGGILFDLRHPGSVEIDADTRTGTDGYESERRHRCAITPFQRIVQRLGDEGAHTHPPGGRFAAHLSVKSVAEGDRRAHDEENNAPASLHQPSAAGFHRRHSSSPGDAIRSPARMMVALLVKGSTRQPPPVPRPAAQSARRLRRRSSPAPP